MNLNDKYNHQIKYIESIANIQTNNYMSNQKNPKICLQRLKLFLKLLDNPQKKINNYIQIGGTSGKGSVATFLQEILVAAGYKTGLFTSPFLTETTEKYKINHKLISQKDFCEIVEKLKPKIDEFVSTSKYGAPSYFEICYIIAIMYFKKNKCQYNIFEVGCGGEYDATNVVDKKIITCITHVDYDHTDILGNSLKMIATTKSKIISKKSNFFTSESRDYIRRIFSEECKKQKAKYNYIKPKYSKINFKNNKVYFEFNNEKYSTNLIGEHQVKNSTLAIKIAEFLKIDRQSIKKGVRKTKIPARFELVKNNPYTILDVAHNPDKIKSTLDNIGLYNFDKLNLVYASAANKDLEKIAKILSPFTNNLIISKFLVTQRKCADPKNIFRCWKKYNKKINIKIVLDPFEAYDRAQKLTKKNDMLLVCGSFFICGELRKKWFSSEYILKKRKVIE